MKYDQLFYSDIEGSPIASDRHPPPFYSVPIARRHSRSASHGARRSARPYSRATTERPPLRDPKIKGLRFPITMLQIRF